MNHHFISKEDDALSATYKRDSHKSQSRVSNLSLVCPEPSLSWGLDASGYLIMNYFYLLGDYWPHHIIFLLQSNKDLHLPCIQYYIHTDPDLNVACDVYKFRKYYKNNAPQYLY